MEISAATYNVHRCIGTDGVQSHKRIVRVLGELEADVIALQEVETFEGENLDFVRTLQQTSDCAVIPGHTMFKDNAHYGNLLLTRMPVLSQLRIDISYPGREPRGAIVALVQSKTAPVLLIATHLGLRPRERRFQVNKLMQELKANELWTEASLRILLGDFNEWHHWGRPLRRIRALFGNAPAQRSFPASRPLLALDRIWVHPLTALLELSSHRSVISRVASDHLPLKARMTVPDVE